VSLKSETMLVTDDGDGHDPAELEVAAEQLDQILEEQEAEEEGSVYFISFV